MTLCNMGWKQTYACLLHRLTGLGGESIGLTIFAQVASAPVSHQDCYLQGMVPGSSTPVMRKWRMSMAP